MIKGARLVPDEEILDRLDILKDRKIITTARQRRPRWPITNRKRRAITSSS
jgi:hypothetical protein